jgi:hypothetical protein
MTFAYFDSAISLVLVLRGKSTAAEADRHFVYAKNANKNVQLNDCMHSAHKLVFMGEFANKEDQHAVGQSLHILIKQLPARSILNRKCFVSVMGSGIRTVLLKATHGFAKSCNSMGTFSCV